MSAVATAASGLPGGTVLVLALLWAAGYATACTVWPLTAHARCNGTGKLRSPSGRMWRRCPGCRGTGTKLRLGRRLFNATTRRSCDMR